MRSIELNEKFLSSVTNFKEIRNVSQDPNSIKWINNPDESIQMAAVKKSGRAIQYIQNPTLKVQDYIANRNSDNIYLVKNISKDILEKYKQQLINGILTQLRDMHEEYMPSMHYRLQFLKKFVNWPELMTVIEGKKHEIIKNLLEHFRLNENQTHIVLSTAEDLKESGINWPELDIIIKSCNYELNKYR
jgi:hypothetical protein